MWTLRLHKIMTQENKGGKFLSSDIRYKCNGHEFGQTLGDGEGQRGLADCSRGVTKVGHDWVTEQQQ